MTRTVTIRGKTITADEDTPLTASALLEFFTIGRNSFYADVARGYVMEFGTLTTPKHYRAWLRANPRPARRSKKSEETSRMARELSRLH
jgi:hypothetical protein